MSVVKSGEEHIMVAGVNIVEYIYIYIYPIVPNERVLLPSTSHHCQILKVVNASDGPQSAKANRDAGVRTGAPAQGKPLSELQEGTEVSGQAWRVMEASYPESPSTFGRT